MDSMNTATIGCSINSNFASTPFSPLKSPPCANRFKLSPISSAALKVIFKKLPGNLKGSLHYMPSALIKRFRVLLETPLYQYMC